MPDIIVVGSINMDLVVHLERHPLPGETLLGSDYQTFPGGKGANQAVAAARAGGSVRMVGCLGSDGFGAQLLEGLAQDGIDTRWIKRMEGPSGVAFIAVNAQGQNSIIVAPGSNYRLLPEDLNAEAFQGAKVVLLQLEVPLPTALEAARRGREAGAQVILNAAPARNLTADELRDVNLLVVNEFEAGVVLGRKAPEGLEGALAAAQGLCQRVSSAVITLGAEGCVWADSSGQGYVPAFPVQPVDTTAAGDAFVGMLASRLAKGEALAPALRWASAAGALATTQEGAQPSLPTEAEVASFLAAHSSP
ncbi:MULTISPECIES: ribokinase [unclassified Meiothermus]|uniref:ribokinase n=1 Tax=unclassified Meiothermus TaxID=370471 RepID=UPI000D7BEFD0|nr:MULTISPECIES: ribokinase [unclassified Meiothermus]PZA06378.1 ribokinase [Meiothermus sp. Pnk-1]RYM37003.1 ribokinase [Meiothermus sp. PNK-Is4]